MVTFSSLTATKLCGINLCCCKRMRVNVLKDNGPVFYIFVLIFCKIARFVAGVIKSSFFIECVKLEIMSVCTVLVFSFLTVFSPSLHFNITKSFG